MNRLALLAVVLAASPIAAELNVVAKLEDPRIGERKVYLSHTWANSRGEIIKDGDKPADGWEIIACSVYLPKGDVPEPQSWVLVFETAEVLRQTIQICKHNPTGTKVKVTGREVTTLRGRGLLISEIKSNW